MASNSAERASRPVENAGVSGSGVDEGGSTEPLAAALNKEAARRSSGVGGTRSHDSRVWTSASGTRARNTAGSTTGTSVGAGSKKAKPAGRTGARNGSGKTSQPSGATRAPTSEQETPESGTKRPGSSAGAEAAEPSSEEDAQQPPNKSKKKRKKSTFDLQVEAWTHYRRQYDDKEKEVMLSVAIDIGAKFHGQTFAYVNPFDKNAWKTRVAQPVVKELGENPDYVRRMDVETVEDVFLSQFGLVKMEKWYKSTGNQAKKYFDNNPDEGTGASGGKPPNQIQMLRQRLYENHPAVNKNNLHESQGGLPSDSDGGGGGDEDPEGDFGGGRPGSQ